MHIVFGGAFNGKREYVKELLGNQSVSWHEASLPGTAASLSVIAGVEKWVKNMLEDGKSEEEIIKEARTAILLNESSRQIWILTDINRGIVPFEPLERQQRDVVGRLYQFLFKEAESITRVWYGIPEIIKGAKRT
ncbi:bifunctional adenosylcobinamide kinase/adenosylcobinamide-phosphate guanylyltransferase [Planococcus shixiaomingii]|uniref:bifunctional adenosylcobinamide kinase/adenosylcobinamide-phosphate guanylyltransferase n=1 Tax=Planococcus shixiaomingii TaxID=3058393 RepID=UPI00262EE9FE|nr:bifunctional adenosylcobinamide kinase/adenosylcobinamide-phosphate guanylyltransferase [Planococcus sp. N022]WKA54106.1 bifunctional adenosylcobinamide kinase/adenosylcobinamide-phosphate guanylyltransferase [Planococcus sp. N022]